MNRIVFRKAEAEFGMLTWNNFVLVLEIPLGNAVRELYKKTMVFHCSFSRKSNLYLSSAVPPHCFWEQKYSWFLVLLITCKFDFSCQVVNTDVEITPGHILWHYTFTTESRVWASNLRTQFFHFSASLNTATVLEILACIAVNVPTELVRWVQTIMAEDSSKDVFIPATSGFHWLGYQNKLHWQKLPFPSTS